MKPGDRLADRYLLVERIGEGGMGEVWRGEQIALGRAVAIKVIHREHGESSPELRGRFQREAELAAKVEHRNVIDIIDYGIADDGAQYLVMPFLRGSTLHERLRHSGAPSLEDVVRWTSATLGGLAAIHDRGIIHRDLKPANVFLAVDADGVVPKLLDFGISRSEATPTAGLTGLGAAIGTPQYMAPEQFESARDVDVRADLYGIGAMLYEAVTGAPPFTGTDAFAIYRELLQSSATSIGTLRPDVPEELATIIERAIDKDPDARWPSARAMRSALDEVIADGGLAELSAIRPADADEEDIGMAATTPSSEAMADAARTPKLIDVHGPTEISVGKSEPKDGARRTPNTTPDEEATTLAKEREPLHGGRNAWLVGATVVLSIGIGVGVIAMRSERESPVVPEVIPPSETQADAATTEAQPDTGVSLAGATGVLLSEPADLGPLALRWARVAPDDRGVEIRFVPAEGRWAIAAPASTPGADLARLAEALGHAADPADWDPDRGLAPTLARTRVRLNVHLDPTVDSPTQRILPHDTVVVALYGHVDDGLSQDGEEAMTYFAVSEAEAGWARASFLEPFWGCVPRPDGIDLEVSENERALARDAVFARTRARTAGGWRDVWLLAARDSEARRSVLAVFEAQAGCDSGERLFFSPVSGVLDELFFTETGRAGVSLLVFSHDEDGGSAETGMMRWNAHRLDGTSAWDELLPTAMQLPDAARATVSGTRDRILRNRRDGRVLAIRLRGQPERFFRFENGALAEVSTGEGE